MARIENGPVQVVIKPANERDENGQPLAYSANLKRWFASDIRFETIERADFTGQMVLGVREFDRDNTMYVLLPKQVFQADDKESNNHKM